MCPLKSEVGCHQSPDAVEWFQERIISSCGVTWVVLRIPRLKSSGKDGRSCALILAT